MKNVIAKYQNSTKKQKAEGLLSMISKILTLGPLLI